VPTGPRPTRTDVFGQIGLNYKLALNVIATVIFVALLRLSRRSSPSHHCEHHAGTDAPERTDSAHAGV
jgi:hypothetical protein